MKIRKPDFGLYFLGALLYLLLLWEHIRYFGKSQEEINSIESWRN